MRLYVTDNGNYFVDVNECNEQEASCDQNAYCVNTVGSFKCICKDGFTMNGYNCEGSTKLPLFPRLAYVILAVVPFVGIISILLFLRRRKKMARSNIEEVYLLPFTDDTANDDEEKENDHSAINKMYVELEECQNESEF